MNNSALASHILGKLATRGDHEAAVAILAQVLDQHRPDPVILPAPAMAAARNMDWGQVAGHGGPPCFHLEDDGRFCGRAERWEGHRLDMCAELHRFVPLEELLRLVCMTKFDATPPEKTGEVPVYYQLGPDDIVEAGDIAWDSNFDKWRYVGDRYFRAWIGKKAGLARRVLRQVKNQSLPGPESGKAAREPENSPSEPPH